MSNRQQAIEKIARFLVANEDMSARKVAAEIVTLYEQTVGLRPVVHTILENGEYRKITAWTTPLEVGSEES